MLSATPKEQLDSIQLVVDFVQAFKLVASNPNIEKLAKDAYALPEGEKKRLDEALAKIAEHRAVLVSIQKEREALEKDRQSLAEQQRHNNATLDKIGEENRKLNQRQADLDKIAASQAETAKALEQKKHDLDVGNAKLEVGNANLAEQRKQLNALESDLKQRAQALKQVTEGM